ncbi:MAG: hypothetical protein LBV43_07945 [Prevotella sp.]|nr:hypothetical protein [Prevotella sp.]
MIEINYHEKKKFVTPKRLISNFFPFSISIKVLNENLENGKGNAKKINSQISELEKRTSLLGKSINDIDQLGADTENKYALSQQRTGEQHRVREGSDGMIYIDTSSDALTIHEVTHVRQSLDAGGLKFEGGELLNAGVGIRGKSAMEVEAYRAQYSFDRSFPGSLRGGLQGIDVHSVGNIRKGNGQLQYRYIFEHSQNVKKQEKIGRKLVAPQ